MSPFELQLVGWRGTGVVLLTRLLYYKPETFHPVILCSFLHHFHVTTSLLCSFRVVAVQHPFRSFQHSLPMFFHFLSLCIISLSPSFPFRGFHISASPCFSALPLHLSWPVVVCIMENSSLHDLHTPRCSTAVTTQL